MADITLNFAGAPDANPYVPVGPWANAYGTGVVINQGWRFGTGALGQAALWNTSVPFVSSGIIHMRISTKVVDNSAFGVYICNASGNGYMMRVRLSDGIQMFNAVAWDTPTNIGAAVAAPSYSVDDVFDFYRDCDTGDMWIEHEGVELLRRNSSAVTYNLRGAMYSRGGRMGLITYADTAVARITNINSGQPVALGSHDNTLTVSDFISDVTLLDIGGLEITPTGSGDNYTFNDPGFIDGSVDPGFGTLSAVASNVGETSSGFNVTRTLDSALTAVALGTLSEDPETIAAKAAAQGLTIAAADTLYYGDGLTIYGDGTISDAEDGDHEVWHRDEATDVMTMIIVTIGAGVVIGVGITMRALTASAITMRNLTMRSL